MILFYGNNFALVAANKAQHAKPVQQFEIMFCLPAADVYGVMWYRNINIT